MKMKDVLDNVTAFVLADELASPVVLRNSQTGEQVYINSRTHRNQLLSLDNWAEVETPPDGFRPRRKRPKGWYEKAIKDGVIADPEKGVPERVKTDNEYVVEVPVAKVTAERK